MTSLGQKLVTE